MPNVQVHMADAVFAKAGGGVVAVLPDLRDLLCARLAVDQAAGQWAVLPVCGRADQPQINSEIGVPPRPDRRPALILDLSRAVRFMLAPITGTAVLDPVTYVALKERPCHG